ncbi:unnamed protein product [Musa hybrid cultivar]
MRGDEEGGRLPVARIRRVGPPTSRWIPGNRMLRSTVGTGCSSEKRRKALRSPGWVVVDKGRRPGRSRAAGVVPREPAAEVRGQGGGILKLYDDVQMCGYEDVQVMWEILTKSEMETSNGMPKQRRRSLWRVSSWYSRSTAASAPIQAYE